MGNRDNIKIWMSIYKCFYEGNRHNDKSATDPLTNVSFPVLS